MRIISDFHDYYDAVQATGQDQTLIYIRRPEEVQVREYPLPVFSDYLWDSERSGLQVQQHIVGFCGKVYPVLVLTLATTNKPTICHNLDEVDCFVEGNLRKGAIQEYSGANAPKWRRRWPSRRCVLADYFAECSIKRDSFVEMFLEKRCPLFIGTSEPRRWRARAGRIVYNGCLKELDFFRLFDSYTAFQEIAMFLGGMAAPEKVIPQVPDKVMVGAKGFDRWSFRKPPRRD